MDILDWDIEGVIEMGVQAETGKALGSDFSADSLFEGDVEAVFLATGGWDSRLARGAGAGGKPGTGNVAHDRPAPVW